MGHIKQQEQASTSSIAKDIGMASETEKTSCLSFLGAGLEAVCCGGRKSKTKMGNTRVEAVVVLQMKNVLDCNDFRASLHDGFKELLGHRVSLQLVSAVQADPENETRPRVGAPAFLEDWPKVPAVAAVGDTTFKVEFYLDEGFGMPGAFIIRNLHKSEFYLKTVTLQNVPGEGKVHFACYSWVYPADKYKYNRVFFANQSYLPSETPALLKTLRETELIHLRGDGMGELQEWDRVYDYAFYNDLGDPDKGKDKARPVLGGSVEYPYPRRGRTGRPPTQSGTHLSLILWEVQNGHVQLPAKAAVEIILPVLNCLHIYVPRDERFGQRKMSDFLASASKSIVQVLVAESKALFDKTRNEFDTFQDVFNLYEGGIKLPDSPALKKVKDKIPLEIIKKLVPSDGEQLLKFLMPQVIKHDKRAWRTDEEFAREMLAGINPVVISRLEEFPPKSKLDPAIYGPQTSTITAERIEKFLQRLTVEEALNKHRLFILDHYEAIMPYLNRINTTGNKIYASRTLLFLKDDGTLTPLAIELCLPNHEGQDHGAVRKVYTPADYGVEASLWDLAKAYAAVDDSGHHQLISHWLNTHATMEPFVIASNRQLSVMHPIFKLLQPHLRDTMYINAVARQILLNAGGVMEKTVFPARYAMEMSAVVYKSWNFTEQGLPADLLKRGIAVQDSSRPHGLRLLIEDYPYAVDGLEIWFAIRDWVHGYCSIYYKSDHAIQSDTELQAWWHEVRYVGHGDKKHEPWWPKMQNLHELVESLTTIIWVASALHAALNFGQYPYAGFLPNRPTLSRRFMPEPGTKEYAELEKDPDSVFLKTITAQMQTLLGISLIEILSRHSPDEVYLGQNIDKEWSGEEEALCAFRQFGGRLVDIENRIMQMNGDSDKWKNRNGPVRIPYTLLYPNTSDLSGAGGITGKGIPNSTSI
ncbi:Arachidonate 12-lipoxygenase 12S-type [Nymphaea thermarum]|nr:Arachidonate 12-lipoxygenase 12S-type [Nymphaea thermarum]